MSIASFNVARLQWVWCRWSVLSRWQPLMGRSVTAWPHGCPRSSASPGLCCQSPFKNQWRKRRKSLRHLQSSAFILGMRILSFDLVCVIVRHAGTRKMCRHLIKSSRGARLLHILNMVCERQFRRRLLCMIATSINWWSKLYSIKAKVILLSNKSHKFACSYANLDSIVIILTASGIIISITYDWRYFPNPKHPPTYVISLVQLYFVKLWWNVFIFHLCLQW